MEKDPNLEMDIIIAGTLPKLVERLTYEKYPGILFIVTQVCRYGIFAIFLDDLQNFPSTCRIARFADHEVLIIEKYLL